ncbi:hypothetical protein LCGC14_2778390, partial [marine sediment metagenome]
TYNCSDCSQEYIQHLGENSALIDVVQISYQSTVSYPSPNSIVVVFPLIVV